MGKGAPVQIDVPCDVQQIDDTGYVRTFLHEARDQSLIAEGAIVVTADEVDPVVARVVDLVPSGDRTIVHLEILPGDPLDYADALSRARTSFPLAVSAEPRERRSVPGRDAKSRGILAGFRSP